MKSLARLLAVLVACTSLGAKPTPGEELEFRIEPSFSEGVFVYLGCESGPKVRCLPFTLPRLPERDDFGKPVPLKEARVSSDEFEALASAIESAELRKEAESTDPVGADGEIWIFRRKIRGRTSELRFWSPDKSSAAYRLGVRFLRAAQIKAP